MVSNPSRTDIVSVMCRYLLYRFIYKTGRYEQMGIALSMLVEVCVCWEKIPMNDLRRFRAVMSINAFINVVR